MRMSFPVHLSNLVVFERTLLWYTYVPGSTYHGTILHTCGCVADGLLTQVVRKEALGDAVGRTVWMRTRQVRKNTHMEFNLAAHGVTVACRTVRSLRWRGVGSDILRTQFDSGWVDSLLLLILFEYLLGMIS